MKGGLAVCRGGSRVDWRVQREGHGVASVIQRLLDAQDIANPLAGGFIGKIPQVMAAEDDLQ